MKIESIRIRNFRSVSDLTLDLNDLTALCGGNSSGKSNVFRAIRYALTEGHIDKAEVGGNLPVKMIHGQGGPRLSTWIDIKFSECPDGVAKIVGQKGASAIEYNFRAMRSGTVLRKLMGHSLDDNSFSELLGFFDVIYIPPIRDLNNGGMEPFHRAFSTALAKARGVNNLRNVEHDAKAILESRADTVLVDQKQLLKTHAGVENLKIDCSGISLDDLYEKVSLAVTVDGHDLKIDDLGTGHQSLLIMDLFEHLESSGDASRLFLFEEPDNHLHPSAIRTVSSKMMHLSKTSQVIATTHSPIFVHAVGMNAVRPLAKNVTQETIQRKVDLSGYTEKQLSSILLNYGLRITEALFCTRAIVVEGPADVLTLKIIYQLREGRSVDDEGILIVDAGGTSGVKELTLLFDKLSVPCMAMLDWDAVEAGKLPQFSPGDDDNVMRAIETIKRSIPENRATKRGVLKALKSVEDEIGNPVSEQIRIYNGSICEDIVTQLNKLTKSEQSRLVIGLKVGRKAWYTPLLKKSCLWVHDTDLEQAIISTPHHAQEAQMALSAIGVSVSADMTSIHGFLHNSANCPEVFEVVISELEKKRLFSKSRFNTMYQTLFK